MSVFELNRGMLIKFGFMDSPLEHLMETVSTIFCALTYYSYTK